MVNEQMLLLMLLIKKIIFENYKLCTIRAALLLVEFSLSHDSVFSLNMV